MDKHVSQLKFTHRNTYTADTFQQTKDEIFKMIDKLGR